MVGNEWTPDDSAEKRRAAREQLDGSSDTLASLKQVEVAVVVFFPFY